MNTSRPSAHSRCPHCRTLTLQASPRQGPMDQIMKWVRRRPMRCTSCDRRCYIVKKVASTQRGSSRNPSLAGQTIKGDVVMQNLQQPTPQRRFAVADRRKSPRNSSDAGAILEP